MSTSNDVVLLFGIILAFCGMIQGLRKEHLTAGLGLIAGGVCVGLWSVDHILTSPIHIAWPGLLFLATIPMLCILMGFMHLFDAYHGED